jgi:hypothetical protein
MARRKRCAQPTFKLQTAVFGQPHHSFGPPIPTLEQRKAEWQAHVKKEQDQIKANYDAWVSHREEEAQTETCIYGDEEANTCQQQ